TIAAAQQMDGDITVLVPGGSVRNVAGELAAAQVKEVVPVEHRSLEPYTPDGFTAALQDAIAQLSPTYVLLPHTYQTRDFAPKLAARLDRAIITDVVAIKRAGSDTAFVRPMFQGKLTADVVPQGQPPHFVTFQIGAYRIDQAVKGSAPAPVRALTVNLDASAIRQKPDAPFQQAKQAVDLSQAERIVSVGRGIKEQANIKVAEELARALGAELAASRPICDCGWQPQSQSAVRNPRSAMIPVLVFWLLFVIFIGAFAAQVARRVRLILAAPNTFNVDRIAVRAGRWLGDVLFQRRTILERPIP